MRNLLRLVKYAMERRALFIGAAIVMAAGSVPYMVIPRLAGNAIDEALAHAQSEVAFIVGLHVPNCELFAGRSRYRERASRRRLAPYEPSAHRVGGLSIPVESLL